MAPLSTAHGRLAPSICSCWSEHFANEAFCRRCTRSRNNCFGNKINNLSDRKYVLGILCGYVPSACVFVPVHFPGIHAQIMRPPLWVRCHNIWCVVDKVKIRHTKTSRNKIKMMAATCAGIYCVDTPASGRDACENFLKLNHGWAWSLENHSVLNGRPSSADVFEVNWNSFEFAADESNAWPIVNGNLTLLLYFGKVCALLKLKSFFSGYNGGGTAAWQRPEIVRLISRKYKWFASIADTSATYREFNGILRPLFMRGSTNFNYSHWFDLRIRIDKSEEVTN